ncbi:MAG: sugar transferase [Verrucomicrobiota bacterium]|jgi:exopolysaccharide biosynthesis polyprenyl glycosylphosphotransferase
MLHRDRQIRITVDQFVDGGLFALGLWLGWLIRYHWRGLPIEGMNQVDPIPDFSHYFWLFLVVIPVTPLILEWQGYYQRAVFSPRHLVAWQLAKACAISIVFVILTDFMLRFSGARGVYVLFGICSFVLMMLKGELLRWTYQSKLGQTQFKRRIVFVGTPVETRHLREIAGSAAQELEILAEFDLNKSSVPDLVSFFHEHAVNTVIINASHTVLDRVEAAIGACELEGLEVWLLADFFKTHISRTSLDDFFGQPVFVFHSGPEMPWSRVIKQMVDLVGGLVLLVVFAIPMLIAAAVIKMTSKGPVLFRQERSGLNGKPFTMYKFRTMVTNAEQLKRELAVLNEMSGPVFKLTNDPRITPFGRFLRKFSIDEFPQLFNVLRFEMSLVGPRPLPVDEVQRFDDVSHRRRLSVKPGLTCLWQVSGRNDIKDFSEWVRLDLEYIDNWTIWLDFRILWHTIWVVLLGRGAR